MENVLPINSFLRALSSENRLCAYKIVMGSVVTVESRNNGIVNGVVDEILGEDLILKIGKKSMFAINAKSILKINIDSNLNFKNGDGGDSGD